MSEIDVEKQLEKQIALWEGLSNKRLKVDDWVSELVTQVYALNKIVLQQQEEIVRLQSDIQSLNHTGRNLH